MWHVCVISSVLWFVFVDKYNLYNGRMKRTIVCVQVVTFREWQSIRARGWWRGTTSGRERVGIRYNLWPLPSGRVLWLIRNTPLAIIALLYECMRSKPTEDQPTRTRIFLRKIFLSIFMTLFRQKNILLYLWEFKIYLLFTFGASNIQ